MAPTAPLLRGPRVKAIKLLAVIKALHETRAFSARLVRSRQHAKIYLTIDADRLGVKFAPPRPSNTWSHVLSQTTKKGSFLAYI
jgi:hypothetical protein